MEEILTNISALIEDRKWKALKDELSNLDSIQIAELLKELSDKESIILFRLLNRAQSKDVFQLLPLIDQQNNYRRPGKKYPKTVRSFK